MRKAILFFYAIDFLGKLHPFALDEIKSLLQVVDEIHLFCIDTGYRFEELANDKRIHVHLVGRKKRYCALHHLFNQEVFKEIVISKQFTLGYFRELFRTVIPGAVMYRNARKVILHSDEEVQWLVESYWMDCSAYAAAMVKKHFPSVHSVTRVHGKEVNILRNKYAMYEMKRFISEQLDHIVFISNDGLKMYESIMDAYYGKKYTDKTSVIHLGVNRISMSYSSKSIDKKLRVVSCSRIVPLKRVELIARALKHITGINVEWTHFGSGDSKELFRIVKSFGDNIKVCFKGNCSNDEIHEYYSSNYIDLFVNVSTTEGIPVSIMEALAYRIPVIATDVGGTSEIVNQSNGFLLNPDITEEKLAKVLCNYYHLDSTTKESLRIGAEKTWQNLYNKSQNQKLFLQLLLTSNGK